jgi:hypothetical protein
MTAREIEAASLTTFAVDPDGAHVRINVCDRNGSPASLVLPAACLNQLLMSMPLMVQTALRNRYGDDSLRLVYPLERYAIELGEPDAQGKSQFILTLDEGNGFSVSFSSTADMLAQLARSLFEDIAPDAQANIAPRCTS